MRPKTLSPTSSSRTRGEAHHRTRTPLCEPSACVRRLGGTWLEGRLAPVPVGMPPTLSTLHPPHRARMSAAQCLAHPWLNNLAEKAKRCNRRLKSQILLKKYLMKRRWKVPRGWGWLKGGAAGRDALLAPGSGPTGPALAGSIHQAGPVWKTGLAFLFVLGWLLTSHPPPPP